MKRIIIMILRNLIYIPGMAIKLFRHAAYVDKYTEEELDFILKGLSETEGYGLVLRAKGIVPAIDGGNWHFDYTVSKKSYEKMEEIKDVNRVIVIGSGLNKKELRKYIYSFGEEL